uniref:Cys-rich domain protein n=1 Tax=Solanum tuberosum TaxID=4113 RepID=M1CN02_SOLTU
MASVGNGEHHAIVEEPMGGQVKTHVPLNVSTSQRELIMQRLGFGNMYAYIATLLLFCMAPFWIFILAIVNIDSDTVKLVFRVTGIFLSPFRLLYGGFWRIQMRKRYNSPSSSSSHQKSQQASSWTKLTRRGELCFGEAPNVLTMDVFIP